MDNVTYKIVFEGDLMPGFELPVVQRRIAELFRIDVPVAARFFFGKQRVIKRGITYDQAKKYIRAMSKLGALAFMLPHEEEDTVLPQPDANGNFTETGSFDARAFEAYFAQRKAMEAADEEQTLEVPKLIEQGMIEKTDWGEVSGERKIREIELIAKQVLMQRSSA
jgi:hypothetical protein